MALAKQLASPPGPEVLAAPGAQADPQERLASLRPVGQPVPQSPREMAKAPGQRVVLPVEQV